MPIKNREGALYWATGIDNSGLIAGRQQAAGILRGLSRQVTGMDVFAGVGIAAGLAFGRAASDLKNFSKEYEQSMREVQTISSAVQGDFEGYSQAIVDLSTRLPQSANELSKAYYQIVSAGYDGAAGLELLRASAQGAVGGVTDVTTAADGMTTVLNAWKISTEDASTVADQFFTTVRLGKTTFGELASGISEVAPLASAMGISFNEVLAAIATLTKQGTPTTQAMTQIRQAIIALSENLGDGWSNAYTFQEALVKLRESAGGSDNKLKEMVGRIEGVNAVLALTGENATMAASDLNEVAKSAGSAEAAFRTMLESEVNQSKILQNNIQAALKPIGDFLSGKWQGLAKSLNETFKNSTDRFSELAGEVERAEKNLTPMLQRYEQLKSKANLSAVEQDELNRLIGDIGSIVPSAVTQFDEYGTALDVSAGKAKDWIEKQKLLLQYMNREAIEENEKALKKIEGNIKETQRKLQGGGYSKVVGYQRINVTYNDEEILQFQSDLEALQKKAEETRKLIAGLKGEFDLSMDSSGKKKKKEGGGDPEIINYYQELQKNIEQTKTQLEQLAAAPGKMDREAIKKQQEILNGYQNEMDYIEYILGFKKMNLELDKSTLDIEQEIGNNLEAIADKQKKAQHDEFINSIQKSLNTFKEFEARYSSTSQRYAADLKALEKAFKNLGSGYEELYKELLKFMEADYNAQMLSEISNVFSEISSFLSEIDQKAADIVSNISGVATGVGNILASAGNPLQVITGLVQVFFSVVSMMENGGDSLAQSFADNLEEVNRLLKEQERIIENSQRKGGQKQALLDDIKLEQKAADIAKDKYESYLKFIEQYKKDQKGNLPNNIYEAQLEQMQKTAEAMKNEWEDAEFEVEKARQAYKDFLSGLITEVDIADKIAEAFEEGKTSVEDFAEFTNDLLRRAVLESFTASILGPAITEAQEYLASALGDGILSEDEVAKFKGMMNNIMEGSESIWENFTSAIPDVFGENKKGDQGSLSGSIRANLTEETGSILAGHMNAMRLDVRSLVLTLTAVADTLTNISNNTGISADRLDSIDSNLTGLRNDFKNMSA